MRIVQSGGKHVTERGKEQDPPEDDDRENEPPLLEDHDLPDRPGVAERDTSDPGPEDPPPPAV